MERTHEELRELVGADAIGALSPEEAAEVRSHLRTCAECSAEAEALGIVSARLSSMVAPEPPPSGFADRVMARLAAERHAAGPVPAPARRRPWAFAAAVAALLVGVVGLSASLIELRDDHSRTQQVAAAIWETTGGLDLAGPGEASGKVLPSEEGGSILVARGLGEIPEGRTYQMWLMRGACDDPARAACEKVGAATFEAEEGVAVVRTESSLRGFVRAAVTVEPDGGSEQPTTAPVLLSR